MKKNYYIKVYPDYDNKSKLVYIYDDTKGEPLYEFSTYDYIVYKSARIPYSYDGTLAIDIIYRGPYTRLIGKLYNIRVILY